jgi:hypothetical protein
MMRLDAMLGRLPPVYDIRPGGLLHDFLQIFALALTAYDEDMDRVQRAHWVDTAFALDDLTKIGALFGITPAGWEGLELYRERLKAMIAGRLKGAVTADVIEYVLLRILIGVKTELGDEYIDLPARVELGDSVLARSPLASQSRGSFIEFPPRLARAAELASQGALRQPLARFTLTNKGMEPAALLGRIRGVQGLKTAVPALVNLSTGSILLYADLLECGQMLELSLDVQGRLRGHVGDRDVSAKLWTGEGFSPGARFTPVQPDPEPQPIMLARGSNDLWFFPLALYDVKGLDTAGFASPLPDLEQGRFGEGGSRYDRSLFFQSPAVSLDLWWTERAPASFRIDIPAGVVLRPASRPGRDAEVERAQLFALLQDTVSDLRAAGVDGRVAPLPLCEEQRLTSRAVVMHPKYTQETQRLHSALAGLSALFDTTAIDGARFE